MRVSRTPASDRQEPNRPHRRDATVGHRFVGVDVRDVARRCGAQGDVHLESVRHIVRVRSSTLPLPNPTVPCGVCVRVYTTAAYTHLADAHLVAAAETVGNVVAKSMGM